MGGIRQKNKREVEMVSGMLAAAAPPPSTVSSEAVVLARLVAPKDGKVKYAVGYVATVATAGGTTHVQGFKIHNGGVAGTGTTLISAVSVPLAKNDTVILAAGSKMVAMGTGAKVKAGEIIKIVGHESGTPGGSDVTLNLSNLIFEADDDLDPMR
jgi:hypothetical protein